MHGRRDAAAFACAFIAYALFYAAVFSQSLRATSYIAPSDTLDFGVATFLSAPALWTEGMYSGYPVAADPQTLTFYPLLHVFRTAGVCGDACSWNLFMIAAYVLASAGTFLLVWRMSGSIVAAVFGGFTYGFSGVMVAHISHFNQIHAAAWLPLVLYGLYLVRLDRRRPGAFVATVAYAMMWLAGHPQLAVYTFYLCVALVGGWLRIDRADRAVVLQRSIWSATAIGTGLALAAVMFVPMLELGTLSRRASGSWDLFTQDALPPRQLLSLVFPLGFGGFLTPDEVRIPYVGDNSPVQTTSYFGLLPLGVAAVAAVRASTIRSETRLWMAVAGVALLLCLGSATPFAWLFYYAPGYARFSLPARHLFVFTLCVAVASGLGLAQLTSTFIGRRRIAAGLAVVCAAALLAAVLVVWTTPDLRDLLFGHRKYVEWAFVLPLGVAAVLCGAGIGTGLIRARPRLVGALAGVAFVVLHVADLAAIHYVLPGYHFRYAEVPPERVTPHPFVATLADELRESGQRVLASDGSRNRFLLPNLPRAWSIPAASGTGSLGMAPYLDLLGMGGSGDVPADTFASSHRGLDLMSVRYVLVPQQSALAEQLRREPGRWTAVSDVQYSRSDPDTWYAVLANSRAHPRAWCAVEAVPSSATGILEAVRTGQLADGRAFDPLRMALVEGHAIQGGDAAEAGAGDAEISGGVTGPGERRYLVRNAAPCLFVLSDVYYPWWRASVDDASVQVSRVNHAQIAIAVPSGSHLVRLWLTPISLWAGGGVSVVTILLWIALLAKVDVRLRHSDRRHDPRGTLAASPGVPRLDS